MTIDMIIHYGEQCLKVEFDSFNMYRGEGVPTGGKKGQVLKKSGDGDFETEWGDDIQGQSFRSTTRGYYYSYVDIVNRKIYITDTRVVPEIGTDNRYDANFPAPNYPIGGRLCLVNNVKFDWGADGSATISAISGNMISYDGDIGFDTVNEVVDLEVDDYTLFVIEAPEVGAVDVRNPAVNLGSPSSRALGDYSVAGGKDTLALGNYGTALGRETRAHYCATAEGRKSKAIGEHSHAQNYGTIARAKQSHTQGLQTETEETAIAASAEGKGTIATKEASHVQGRWNERDEEQKYVHIVGWGADKNHRKNIHTLDAIGNACFSGDVYVGGAKKESGQKVAIQKDVDSIKSDVSLLDKKVSLLFEGLPNDLFTVDNSEEYTKLVPDNVLKYAFVKEIGGKTYTPKNLYDQSVFEQGSGNSEGAIWYNARTGKFEFSGSPVSGGWLRWGGDSLGSGHYTLNDIFEGVEVGKTYTVSFVSEYPCEILFGYDHYDQGFSVAAGESHTFVMTQELIDDGITFAGGEINDVGNIYYEWDRIDFFEGTGEATDTKVTALEIVGRNRLAPNYPLLKSPITKTGVTFTPMPNGDIVLDGTATSSISLYLVGNEVEAGGDDRLYLEEGSYFLSDVYRQDDTNAYFLIKKRNAAGGGRNSVGIYQSEEYYLLGYVIYLRVVKGASFSNFVMRPYLTKGADMPTDVPPYTLTRFEVPQAVQDLPYYGKSGRTEAIGYNRIEFGENGKAQFIAVAGNDGYALASPMVTDVTPYFGNDYFIPVESGGKITALNEYENDVPTTIVYQHKQT